MPWLTVEHLMFYFHFQKLKDREKASAIKFETVGFQDEGYDNAAGRVTNSCRLVGSSTNED
eukprot:829565-Amphidinium_carterae.1